MTFHIGQKIECVGDFTKNIWYPTCCKYLPKIHGIYHVRATGLGSNHCGILLHEIINPQFYFFMDLVITEPPFHFTGFRPVVERKTDISIFEKMLTGSNVHENI